MKEKIKKIDFLQENKVLKDLEEYRKLKIIKDIDGYPEYVTNGDGP